MTGTAKNTPSSNSGWCASQKIIRCTRTVYFRQTNDPACKAKTKKNTNVKYIRTTVPPDTRTHTCA